MNYTLDENNNPIPCDVHEWGKLSRDEGQIRRRVASEDIGDYHISTVFLRIDHGIKPDKPQLFETMVFDASGEQCYCTHYATWAEAEEGHKVAIQWVKDGCKDD